MAKTLSRGGEGGRDSAQYLMGTVEPRFNDLRFNDIPGITINIRFPGKSYSKMYGAADPSLTIFGLTIFAV